MPTLNTYGYDYTDPRTPPFVPRQRKPWELDGLEAPAPLDSQPPPLPQLSAQPEQAAPAQPQQQAQPSPMAGLRSVVQQGPPPLPKMNPWKQAGEIATGMFLGRGAAEAIWHPKYNRQVEEYGREVGQAEALSKIDKAEEDRQQSIAKAEAQINELGARSGRNQSQATLAGQQTVASQADVKRKDEESQRTSPEATQQQRRKLAEEIGFQPGTPEFNELMVDGKYTDPATKRKVTVHFERDEINGNVTAIKYDETGNPVGSVDVYKGAARNRPPVGPQPPSLQSQTHYEQKADKTYSKWTVFTDPKTGQEVSRREEKNVVAPNQGGGFFAGVSPTPTAGPVPLDSVKPQAQPAAPAAIETSGPPASIVAKMRPGQIADGADGSSWQKQPNGTVKRIK